LFFCFFVFQGRVSLCSPGCPGTRSVDQAGLKLRNLPASASRVLGLKACATTPRSFVFFFFKSQGQKVTSNRKKNQTRTGARVCVCVCVCVCVVVVVVVS
jgi:hypothetical protein